MLDAEGWQEILPSWFPGKTLQPGEAPGDYQDHGRRPYETFTASRGDRGAQLSRM